MKKIVLFALLFALISFSVFAQGFYFDIGGGLGKAWTKIDGEEFVKPDGAIEFALDLGVKAGYGPFGKIPLYVVGELTMIDHVFADGSAIAQFAPAMIGAGIIYYPVRLIQLGAGAGYSFTANQFDTAFGSYEAYDSKGGFAWNASVALDIGKKNSGFLIGLKYFMAFNTLETSNVEQNQSYVGLFMKYAYRNKPFNS